jgi:drug/metabolite transporter (DMT)-like permease
MNKDLKNAAILALLTALISGVSNFSNKIAVSIIKEPVFFTSLKNGLVALLLVGIVIFVGKWREIRTLNRSQIIKLLGVGAIGGSLPFALYFIGLTQTTAINASLIHKTLFVWVAILAIPFLKEKISNWQWVGMALIFAANLFVGGFGGFKFNLGELMIFGATILWAIENIIAKKVLTEVSPITVAAARMMLGTILLIPIAIYRGASFTTLTNLNFVQWQWTILAVFLLLGYVLTWYTALKKAPASIVATLLVPATLVTNILSAIFINHAINTNFILSSILFVLGVSLTIFFGRRTSLTTNNLTGSHA